MRNKTVLSLALAATLIVGSLMLFASGCGDPYVYDPGTGEGAPSGVEEGPVSIGAEAFVSDYQVSANSADAKYSNRTVEVSGGTVTAVFSDYFLLNTIVKVVPSTAGICAGLEVGATVDVVGLVDEYSRDEGVVPILNASVVSD